MALPPPRLATNIAASARATVEHIKELCIRFGAREVYFDDDDFTAVPERVRDVCLEIVESKLEIDWSCMGSVARLDRELLALMVRRIVIFTSLSLETKRI